MNIPYWKAAASDGVTTLATDSRLFQLAEITRDSGKGGIIVTSLESLGRRRLRRRTLQDHESSAGT